MILTQTRVEENIFEVKIEYKDLTIDKNEIISTLGYLPENIPEHFTEVIESILEKSPNLCGIKSGYGIFEYRAMEDKNDRALIGGKEFGLHKIVAGQLKKSDRAALFVCSIGDQMEKWSKEVLKQGDPMLSYLIDTVASITVESVTNLLHDHIRVKFGEEDFKTTNRYSPGYCNWSVAEQHLLFSFFPKNFCGVSLTESALMIPIKSVSGVIGIGKEVKYREYLCDSCGIKDCTYRSTRIHKQAAS